MNLIIQGSKNFVVSDKMKAVIEEKVAKFDFFKDHIKEIDFHLDKEKINFKVDVTMITHKIGTFHFSVADQVMYNAIDKVIHKLDVKIYREKGKLQAHSSEKESYIASLAEESSDKISPVTEIPIASKPMDILEAYLELKEQKSDFLGFINVADGLPTFLRKAGEDAYYIIKPEATGYVVYILSVSNEKAEIADKVREIEVKAKEFTEAQNDIMEQDYHYDLFKIDNKVIFLFKSNSKWFKIV